MQLENSPLRSMFLYDFRSAKELSTDTDTDTDRDRRVSSLIFAAASQIK